MRVNAGSPSRSGVSSACAMAVAALVCVACEAVPTVHVAVFDSETGSPQFRELGPTEDVREVVSDVRSPVADALVVVAPAEPSASAEAGPPSTPVAAPHVASGGVGYDWPVVVSTAADGVAKYRELRVSALPFVGPGRVSRRVTVRAAGYEGASVVVEIDTGRYVLLVPLRPALPGPPADDTPRE